MVNNLDELSNLTEKITEKIEKLELAPEKARDAIRKEILELQKKREDEITKLKSEFLKTEK